MIVGLAILRPRGVFDRSAPFEGATAVCMVSMFECGFLVASPTTEWLFRFFPASIFMHLDLQRNVGCYGIPSNDGALTEGRGLAKNVCRQNKNLIPLRGLICV